MKLSKREITLLAILFVLVLSYLYYTYLLTPQFQKVRDMRSTLTQKQQELSYSKLETNPNNKLYTEYKTLNAKISTMTQGYFPVINQEKIILILEAMIKDSNVNASVVSFTEPGLEMPTEQQSTGQENSDTDPILQHIINEVAGNKAEANSNENKKDGGLAYQLNHMNVTIVFEGSYFNIVKFLKSVEDYEKEIIIKDISIASSQDGVLKGSVGLDFYAIPKLHKQQDEDYLKWDIIDGYGKGNPFAYASSSNTAGAETPIQTNKSDFTLIVSPIMSDLPSVVIGKTVDNRGDTQLYADNAAKEAVEIQVFKSEDKYFYRYKTANSSYPNNYAKEAVAFKPNGNVIKMQVVSAPRTGSQDESGVQVSIVNKTDLEFIVNVANEDSESPRFVLVNRTGKITVNR